MNMQWRGSPDDFLDWLEREKRKLICYGAGSMAADILREPRFVEKITCFVDRDPNKQGKAFRGTNFPVFGPEHLREENLNHAALLITSGWFRDIIQELNEYKELQSLTCVVFPELLAACEPGSEEFFRRRILDECVREYDSSLVQRGETEDRRRQLTEEKRAYLLGDSAGSRPFVLPRIMLLPTTRCNLRCKGCSSLLPLFEHTEDVPLKQNLRDLKLFFRGIDGCIRLTVGGEPFLYPDLPALLEYLRDEDKVFSILLITNSTIQPSREVLSILSDPKFYVEVSDYGHIQQMSKTVAALEGAAVRFRVLSEQVWDDMGGVEARNRSEVQMREIYMNCEQGRLMKSIHNGSVFVCARSARMSALNCGYNHHCDSFVLNEGDSIKTLQEKICGLYFRNIADACDRCDLGYMPGKKIPAGMQISGSLRHSSYTLIRRDEYQSLKALAER